MPHRGDLGLPGAALVALLLGPLLVLLLRRRCRLAAARREEVMRLALLAAEEAARAEEEAVLTYRPMTTAAADGGGPRPPQCAVCYSPTTTRCSRCKAVRYCSGKCQIIHWRQGHKDECHPPQADDHHNGQVTISNLEEVKAGQPDLHNDNLEIEGKSQKEPIVTSPERPSSESNFSSEAFSGDEFADTSGTESSSDSFTDHSLSSCSTTSRSVKTFNDASASKEQSVPHNVNIGEPSSKDPTLQVTGLTKVAPSEFSSVTSSVHSICYASNFQQMASSSRNEQVDHKPGGPSSASIVGPDNYTDAKPSEDAGVCQDALIDSTMDQISGAGGSTNFQFSQQGNANQLGEKSHLHISSDASKQIAPCQTISAADKLSCESAPLEGTVQSDRKRLTTSGTVTSGRSNDVRSLQSKQLKSLSSASADHASSSGRGHYRSRDVSLEVNNAPKVPVKSSENTAVPNGISDLKASVQKVVQQLKSSKVSRHYPSGFGNDISRKNKMLFPYDNFVKLYNCDKMELRPCGLVNCGNSCYANAVLQTLAFTRPLTAYLLQGLHSKACRKREWCFTCEFESLLMKAKQGQSPLSPSGILSHIHKIGSHLGHGREEDAHEFLRYAIDVMQSVCLKEAGSHVVGPLAEETTLIQLTFGGYLRSKIKCLRCRGISERHERMMDLTVEIQGDIGTLEEALRQFTATEILEGENKYHCNRCKSYQRAKKKLTILDAPNILTIALKRFQSGKFGKLNKAVRFPEYLDLTPFMSGTNDKSPLYRLYAVVVHLDVMNAAFSGHYVCYVKSTQGKWYKTDDSMVKPVDLESVLSKNAYMLLYARCSPHAPSLIRNTISHDQVKSKKSQCKEAVCSEPAGERARSRSVISHHASSVVQQSGEDYPYRTTDNHFSYEPHNQFNERFLFPRMDSSSDSSSLLSCSDEGSWSTESTRNSTSTDEYSEYIFGESDHYNWNSPLRFSKDSNGFTHSQRNLRCASEIVSNRHVPDHFKSSNLTSNITSSYHEDGGRVNSAKLWSRSSSGW